MRAKKNKKGGVKTKKQKQIKKGGQNENEPKELFFVACPYDEHLFGYGPLPIRGGLKKIETGPPPFSMSPA
jgi:hypothetical protein